MSTNSHLSDILRRADMEMLRGEWERAEPLYQEARALAPGDPRAEVGRYKLFKMGKPSRWLKSKL